MVYFCVFCKKEVEPVLWKFRHPHLGIVEGKICRVCEKPVMLLEEKEKVG